MNKKFFNFILKTLYLFRKNTFSKYLIENLAYFIRSLLSVFHKSFKKKDINGYKRIYHVHVMRSGGTSINQYLLNSITGANSNIKTIEENINPITRHKKINGLPYVSFNTSLINKGAYFFAHSHQPMHKLKIEHDTFSFTVLREPLDRIFSWYKAIKYPLGSHSKYFLMEKDYIKENFILTLENLEPNILNRQLYTFSKNLDINEGLKNLEKLSKIFFHSNLQEVQKEFESKLGFKEDFIKINSSKAIYDFEGNDENMLKVILSKEYEFYKAALSKFA